MLRHYFLSVAIALPLFLAIDQAAIADSVGQLLKTRACPECELSNVNLAEAELNGVATGYVVRFVSEKLVRKG